MHMSAFRLAARGGQGRLWVLAVRKRRHAAAPQHGVLKHQMFVSSRGKLTSCRPLMRRRRNLANSVVPTLLWRGSRLAFHAPMCRAEGDLEACWNKISNDI